jgi:hypothetical protein
VQFGVTPYDVVGMEHEARTIARELSARMHLYIFIIKGTNVPLPEDPQDGIWVRQIEFDEMDPKEQRCVRRGW